MYSCVVVEVESEEKMLVPRLSPNSDRLSDLMSFVETHLDIKAPGNSGTNTFKPPTGLDEHVIQTNITIKPNYINAM